MADSDERSTPTELFKELDDEFHFELDVCSTNENAKCGFHYTKEDKSLIRDWAPYKCFMNPPYSNIPRWLQKAKDESIKGALVVCILPMDSSTKWFHEFIWDKAQNYWRPGVEGRFPDKRYKFGDNENSAKFATLIVVMK